MRKIVSENVKLIGLNDGNFNIKSLDNFILNQRVTRCWRKVNTEYRLLPVSYTEKWNLRERREKAEQILRAIKRGSTAIAAINDNGVIGFALLNNDLFGSNNQYADLAEFYVSEPFRRRGIGKVLFERICREAKKFGAEKIYISAHSAEESISAYKKYGCVFASEPDAVHIEKEPYDLQLEFELL